MNKQNALALSLAAALLAGCASTSPQGSFSNVQQSIYQRTGEHIQWNRFTKDDRAAVDAVAKLLTKPLTVQSAVQIALLNNHDLQATYEDLGIAQADLVQAGLLKNPIFAAAFEPAEGGQGIKLQMSVMEDFLQILQIPLSRKIAGAKLHSATLLVDKAVIDLAGQVRAVFYRQQAAIALAALRGTAVQVADAGMELANRMHTAGNIADLAYFRQQVASQQARLDFSAAESAVTSGREDLNMLMGLGDDQLQWKIDGFMPDLPAAAEPGSDETATVEHRAVESNFDLSASRWQIAQASAQAGVQDNFALLPDASIGPSAEKESDGLWETGGAVEIPIPIFDFGQSQQAKAQAELWRQRQHYLALASQVRSTARQAAANLSAARLRAQTIEHSILPLRQKILEQLQLQYNGMLAGSFDLLAARQDQVDAGAMWIQSLLDYWLARNRVDTLIAGGM